MTTTKAKLAFVHAMARHTKATVRQCEALMRYAATLQRLAEDDCNVATDEAGLVRREAKRLRIANRVIKLCEELNAPAVCDVVRDSQTIGAGLTREAAEDQRATLLEYAPDVDCKIIVVNACLPIFSGDPRGAVLKVRVPDGFSDDLAGEGICVPS